MEFLKSKMLQIIMLGGVILSGCGPPPPIILDEYSDSCAWNHGGGSPQRSSYLNIETANQPKLLWTKKFRHGLIVEPTTYNGVLLVPSSDKKVYVVSANNGQIIAEIKFRKPLLTPVVIADSIAAFNVGGTKLVISNWLSRNDIWQVDLEDSDNEPLIMDGKVYWIDGLNYVRCYNLDDGNRIWDKHLSDYSRVPLTADDNGIIAVIDQNITYLESNTGEIIWDYHVDGKLRNSPVLENDNLIFATYEGFIGSLDISNGNENWVSDYNIEISAPIGCDDENIYVGTLNRELICIDSYTGEINWTKIVGGPVVAGPTLTEDLAIFVSLDYNIYFTDKKTGDFRYVHNTNGILSTRPIACENRVYVAGEDKHLYCFQFTEE